MAKQHEPNPSAPPVQKVRLRYTKRGRLRFTSHRDVARAFERAIRRAGVPMAYSQGFNPHPKISWVGAAPTGVASEAEYVEMSLVRVVDPQVLAHEVDKALPPGLDVIDAVTAVTGSLPERIHASLWEIAVEGVAPAALRAAVEKFLAQETAMVERLTKDGRRQLDARGAVVSMAVPEDETPSTPAGDMAPGRQCGTIRAVVRQTSPAVRPDDVMSALLVVADLVPTVPVKATRLAQGPLDDDDRTLGDPFAPDRVQDDPTGSQHAGQHESHVTEPSVK
ncbi:TIGR03936 family radical SAM-associated protein [Rhodococcus sp. X156]|uniref:TIGR03936 family radical SAM-associated protein n=1 Tax=Rhodococcus sp. X156 TaxID=2499145 RepID=UPI0019D27BDE|nr:TIGR03936 family radical SAM-associated protein [Rhodococcus sp. X156]